jgi:hypothetical protein
MEANIKTNKKLIRDVFMDLVRCSTTFAFLALKFSNIFQNIYAHMKNRYLWMKDDPGFQPLKFG